MAAGWVGMTPNVQAKPAPTVGRQTRAGENVPRTAYRQTGPGGPPLGLGLSEGLGLLNVAAKDYARHAALANQSQLPAHFHMLLLEQRLLTLIEAVATELGCGSQLRRLPDQDVGKYTRRDFPGLVARSLVDPSLKDLKLGLKISDSPGEFGLFLLTGERRSVCSHQL